MTEVAKLSTTIEVNKIDETLKKLRGFSGSVDETQKKMDEISRKPAKVNVQVDNADKVDGAMQSLLAYGTVAATAFQLVRSAVDFTKHAVALAGAAEKTGEYATATKGLTDEIDQLSVAIGNGLLPQLTEMKTKAIPIISDLVDIQERLNETNKKATVPAWLKAIPIVGGSIVVAQVATHEFGNSTEEAGEKARNAAADLHHWGEAAVEANERAREMALTSEMVAINLSAQEGGDLWNQAAQDLQAYKDEMDGAQAKARDMAVAQSELAESLKWASTAKIAQKAIGEINKAQEDGKITEEERKKAVDNLMLSYGLATKQSIAIADTLPNLEKARQQFFTGDNANKYDEFIRAYNKDAQDGDVNFEKLLTKAGMDPEKVNLFIEGLQHAKKEIDDLVNTPGKVSEQPGFSEEAKRAMAENYFPQKEIEEAGKRTTNQVAEIYAAMEKAVLEGAGRIDLSSFFGGEEALEETVQPIVDGLDEMNSKQLDVVDSQAAMSAQALLVDEAMQIVEERYLKEGAESEILKGKISSLAETYATLEKNILRVLAAQKRVNTSVGTNVDNAEPGNASGADFIVPPGYPHDSYRMNVQSGERVVVIPANERAKGGKGGGITVNGNLIIQTNSVAPSDVISQLSVM